jgi:deoxyribodipyrimidine photolyase
MKMFTSTRKDRPGLRDSLQQQGEVLDERWDAVKVEASQLMTELQETYDDLMRAFKEILERRRERHQKPVVRFVRHYPWVPLVAGAGAITALVIAAKAR